MLQNQYKKLADPLILKQSANLRLTITQSLSLRKSHFSYNSEIPKTKRLFPFSFTLFSVDAKSDFHFPFVKANS